MKMQDEKDIKFLEGIAICSFCSYYLKEVYEIRGEYPDNYFNELVGYVKCEHPDMEHDLNDPTQEE